MRAAHRSENESAFPRRAAAAYPSVDDCVTKKEAIMRKLARSASIFLFILLGGFFVWFGWTYANVKEPLWFHAAAIPETAREAVRPIYFALMSLIGGASIGLGALGLFVSTTTLRKGSVAAASALAAAYATPLVFAAMTAESLAAETGAPTSWRLMGGDVSPVWSLI